MQFYLQITIHLLRLHLAQLFRLLKEIGIARIIILTIIGIIFLAQFIPLIKLTSTWAFIIPLIPAFILFASNSSESSANLSESFFLKSLQSIPIIVRFLRNITFAIPFLFILALNNNYVAIGISLLFLIVLSFSINTRVRENHSFQLIRIQTALLPWNIFIRTGSMKYAIILILGILQYFHISLAFISIIILHLFVLNILQYNESQILLEPYRKKSKAFLNFYLKQHISYFILIATPVLIITAILNLHYLTVFLAVFFVLLIHQCLSIYLKFTFYEPGKDNSDMQSIQTMMLVFLLIPFTIPIPFLYLRRYRIKAMKNLNRYL